METDVLRWSLLVIGSLVIVGLAVHGIWLSRKNSEKKENDKKHKKDQQYQPSGWQPDADSFDEAINDSGDAIVDDLHIKFEYLHYPGVGIGRLHLEIDPIAQLKDCLGSFALAYNSLS